MANQGPASDAGGYSFAIVGRVAHWNPIARELTVGGRVLSVAASVFFVGTLVAGRSITASGYQLPAPSDRWVVTRLRVD